MELFDVVIVGGGPAGLTAAIYSGRGGWKTLVLDPMGGGGQASTTDMIYNYPGFPMGVSGFELMDLMLQQATRFGVNVEYDEAKEITKSNEHFIVKGNEAEYRARTVIYAAGSTPKRLNVPGEEKFVGKGISFCATCDGALFRDKTVAVVGGGDSALTEAEFLTKFAKEVILIHRRKEFRAGMAAIQKVEENPRIKVMTPKVVEEIKGNNVLKSLVLRDTVTDELSEIDVDGLFLYVGLKPNSSPIASLATLNSGGFVITKDNMSTDTEGLYVAGDIREKPLRQVSTAISDGAVAAWSVENYLMEKSK